LNPQDFEEVGQKVSTSWENSRNCLLFNEVDKKSFPRKGRS